MARGAAVYYGGEGMMQAYFRWLPIDFIRSPTAVLAGHAIQDDDLKYLARFDALHSVSLANSDVTDEGVQHLLHLQDLHQIILTGTHVTGDGEAALKRRFPGCRIQR